MMTNIRKFQEIDAWREARNLVRTIYEVTRMGKFARDFQLRNQITDAAVSVMSNIAEGFDRDTDREFMRFLRIAKASASEVHSELYVALDQNYLDQESFKRCVQLVTLTSKLIGGLIRYLEKSANSN